MLVWVSGVSANENPQEVKLSEKDVFGKDVEEVIKEVKEGNSDLSTFDRQLEEEAELKVEGENGELEIPVQANTKELNTIQKNSGTKSYETTIVGEVSEAELAVTGSQEKEDSGQGASVVSRVNWTESNIGGITHYSLDSASAEYTVSSGYSISGEQMTYGQSGPTRASGYDCSAYCTQQNTIYYNEAIWYNIDVHHDWAPVTDTFQAVTGVTVNATISDGSDSWNLSLFNHVFLNWG
ncbi:hypothetical protein [Oceanobacillus kimchii]|uniref:hypothetical protein n=1 Tax=Oceanobacillus kimchii TaxID=746691 RepID=UPI0018A813F4|nr:hypothetical protein [Oceanobacillus kimchii]